MSDQEEEKKIRGLMTDWTQYTVYWVNQVTMLFAAGEYEHFWRLADFVINTYPQEIKEPVLNDIKEVYQELGKASQRRSEEFDNYDYLKTSDKRRMIVIRTKGARCWFKFQDILSARGYKEIKGVSPTRKSKGVLGE
jgi:hypothetical protein